ncbi:MAG: hypothetical protein OIN87_06145 [Candidatus Methanoperedens sp.]|nr:hypothetical protein [Candidatus Methanoperedens sp.]
MAHKFDANKADILDNPERAKILYPEVILEKLELTDEIVLADLGCGTGFFSIPASRQVKKVFALDIQRFLIDLSIFFSWLMFSMNLRKGRPY